PIIISDTFGRAWREGHVNFAIGVAGMDPLKDYRGTDDANGRILHVTTIAVADELAATAEMITAKAINVPVALIRGMPYQPDVGSTASLLRDRTRDMFR
ncbi:MAG TPA: F420-0--gamma-glutamyl ligase, partial [Dehalococcoidia bacterium]|nr:F420-0--gamma-glutamyl ligase [Dehalococcoidia bacterium]